MGLSGTLKGRGALASFWCVDERVGRNPAGQRRVTPPIINSSNRQSPMAVANPPDLGTRRAWQARFGGCRSIFACAERKIAAALGCPRAVADIALGATAQAKIKLTSRPNERLSGAFGPHTHVLRSQETHDRDRTLECERWRD
jgi:hypothetical protein